jgi:hypothetical protein
MANYLEKEDKTQPEHYPTNPIAREQLLTEAADIIKSHSHAPFNYFANKNLRGIILAIINGGGISILRPRNGPLEVRTTSKEQREQAYSDFSGTKQDELDSMGQIWKSQMKEATFTTYGISEKLDGGMNIDGTGKKIFITEGNSQVLENFTVDLDAVIKSEVGKENPEFLADHPQSIMTGSELLIVSLATKHMELDHQGQTIYPPSIHS